MPKPQTVKNNMSSNLIEETDDIKNSLRIYDDFTHFNNQAIKKWLNTKMEMGGGKKWDFVNGYFGEKKKQTVNYEALLARITNAGSQVKRCEGVECYKIESKRSPENNLERAKKYIHFRMDDTGLGNIDCTDKYEHEAF